MAALEIVRPRVQEAVWDAQGLVQVVVNIIAVRHVMLGAATGVLEAVPPVVPAVAHICPDKAHFHIRLYSKVKSLAI